MLSASVEVDLRARTFCIAHNNREQKYAIPDGYDIRVSDLHEILRVANSMIGGHEEDWWEVTHSYKKEPKRIKHYNFGLDYIGDRDFGHCYVQWECDATGLHTGDGFQGFELDEDWLGGARTDQQMVELFYWLAHTEELAMEKGYALEGKWLMRVLEHETGALVQMKISASWSKPPRWKAVPL